MTELERIYDLVFALERTSYSVAHRRALRAVELHVARRELRAFARYRRAIDGSYRV